MKLMYVVKMENEGWWGDKSYTKVGIALDTEQKKIYIDNLAGAAMPKEILMFPLLIREIRYAIRDFLKNYKRVEEFKIEYSTGMSGREDYVLKTRQLTEGGFEIVRKRADIHISCNDKLNYGFDPMYVGDYLELLNVYCHKQNEKLGDYTIRDTIEKLSVNDWRQIRKNEFRRRKVTNIWKVKEPDDNWKQPDEII